MREHGERQAQAWLREGLKAAGLVPGGLQALNGSDPRKLLLADLLWQRTTVSQEWLAQKLAMRSAANVCQQLCRLDRPKAAGQAPAALQDFLKAATIGG